MDLDASSEADDKLQPSFELVETPYSSAVLAAFYYVSPGSDGFASVQNDSNIELSAVHVGDNVRVECATLTLMVGSILGELPCGDHIHVLATRAQTDADNIGS